MSWNIKHEIGARLQTSKNHWNIHWKSMQETYHQSLEYLLHLNQFLTIINNSWALSLIGKNINQHNTLMSSILKPPLGMRKHMDATHSPQSSLVHECQNLTNPPPHGQNWCNKKQQTPHPLGHKKVPKPLVIPINAPYFPGVGGGWWGFQLTGALHVRT